MRIEHFKARKCVTVCMCTQPHPHMARNHWELGFFPTNRTVSGCIWQCKRSQLVWTAQCLCRLPMIVTDADSYALKALGAKDWNTTVVLPATKQLLEELQCPACCSPDCCLTLVLCFVCFLCSTWLVLTVNRVFLWLPSGLLLLLTSIWGKVALPHRCLDSLEPFVLSAQSTPWQIISVVHICSGLTESSVQMPGS